MRFATFPSLVMTSTFLATMRRPTTVLGWAPSTTTLRSTSATTSLAATSRRTFLSAPIVVATTAAVAATICTPMAWAEEAVAVEAAPLDYKAVAADIARLVEANPDKGPTLVRLAWHASGTYDAASGTGGSGQGTIRFAEELAHGGNAGLATTAVQWLEPIYQKYSASGLSHGDLYTLGGVVAIRSMQGPTIPWSSGRVDAPDAALSVTPDGRLPNADSGPKGADASDAAHVRTVFSRMGFGDQEMVALSGAHALGRCHTTASGYDGPWTPTPTTFTNAYFSLLTNLKWIPKDWSGPYQYVDAPTGQLMMLPTDLVLLEDKKFLKYVKLYAKNGDKFNQDFTAAFQKLEELGTSGLVPTEWA